MKLKIVLIAVISLVILTAFASLKLDRSFDFTHTDYPGAAHLPSSQHGWERHLLIPDKSGPMDEPQGGKTLGGTKVSKRPSDCFPPENRNVFWQVDQVANAEGKLCPLNFDADGDGKISDAERNAIRGQNTWLLWAEGNETFWNWLQQKGYGLHDFLVMLDSRERDTRFQDKGLINQPGLQKQTKRNELGLYIDAPKANVRMTQPPDDLANGVLAQIPHPPQMKGANNPHRDMRTFEPGDKELFDKIVRELPKDGVDYSIYGYPSGVVGMRLFPNPDFFGTGDDAKKARQHWNDRVVSSKNDAFYFDTKVSADPELVRPFRPAMTCAFCHVGPHPLNPPADPNNAEWSEMSSVIGNQYWNPRMTLANRTKRNNFLYHFLNSQQLGTIDTSLVSTDHINNANTINSVFEVPARIDRALLNPTEKQSASNLLMPGREDGIADTNPRHTPRVLLDGADSIGVLGALARVYLNIGAFSEEWARCHNPVIGFKPQTPFAISTCLEQSVFWRTTQRFRVKALADFFSLSAKPRSTPADRSPAAAQNASVEHSYGIQTTAPMKFKDTREGKAFFANETNKKLVARGRDVFLKNCAICHSSKQPDGYLLQFDPEWQSKNDEQLAQNRSAARTNDLISPMTLPNRFEDWERFKKTSTYLTYVTHIMNAARLTQDGVDQFFESNYLSNDVRIPVTLIGTNSGRAVGTNAMRGQIWDNFSSEDYKKLPSVGPIRFYNPYSPVKRDAIGFNDSYTPPAGGPGYYRPASLVSIWATAPFLHNNALGIYNGDPSVKGRITAFDDAIDKLLTNSLRASDKLPHDGDLRWNSRLAWGDPGFIYRIPEVTWIDIPSKFIWQLFAGILGNFGTAVILWGLWFLVAVGFFFLASLPLRTISFVLVKISVLLCIVLVVSQFDRLYPWLWVIPVIGIVFGAWLLFSKTQDFARTCVGVGICWVLGIASLSVGVLGGLFGRGYLGDLHVGPIPKGTPVNLIMNMNPESPPFVMLEAALGLTRGILRVAPDGNSPNEQEALRVFDEEAGMPLLRASKCPDFVLDRGHWFGENLTDEEKKQLKVFLKSL